MSPRKIEDTWCHSDSSLAQSARAASMQRGKTNPNDKTLNNLMVRFQ